MKRSQLRIPSAAALFATVASVCQLAAAEVNTRFLFQGQLLHESAPANGNFDLQFSLLDRNGLSVGPVIQMGAVPVAQGVFSVVLDFGRDPFSPPNAQSLSVGVRSGATGDFTILVPPQQIGSSPYAITASGIEGVLPASQLPAAVPILSGFQTFTGTNLFVGPNNQFSGDGANLKNLSADQLQGSLRYDTSARLPLGHGGTTGQCHALALLGNTLLIANGPAGLAVADVSNPQNLNLVTKAASIGYPLAITVAPPLAYVSCREGGFAAFDISNPAEPQLRYQTAQGGTMGVWDVAVTDIRVFTANFEKGLGSYKRLPGNAAPVLVGHNADALGAMGLQIAGTRAYLACHTNGLRIFDISNLTAPTLIGKSSTSVGIFGVSAARGLAVEGNRVFVADHDSGFQIFDVTDPTSPKRVGGDRSASTARRVWVKDGLAYVTCEQNGLRIYDVTGAGNPGLLRILNDGGEAWQALPAGNITYLADGPDGLRSYQTGAWHISDLVAIDSKVQISNDLSVKTLTILGGADLAEPFQVSGAPLEAGSVVVIDDANPGQVRQSQTPYDIHVAGIVSGAKGIEPGVSLQQRGKLEGRQNVALSGRVYVQASAENGPIRPGDMLTTATRPGHAMKATDPGRSHGAVLGKALEHLDHGEGYVLVLVNLQ